MGKFKPKDRPVPDNWKKLIEQECDIRFTFKERLKLLLGWGLIVRVNIFCLNSPGRIFPVWDKQLTAKPKPKPNPYDTGDALAGFTEGPRQDRGLPGSGPQPTPDPEANHE